MLVYLDIMSLCGYALSLSMGENSDLLLTNRIWLCQCHIISMNILHKIYLYILSDSPCIHFPLKAFDGTSCQYCQLPYTKKNWEWLSADSQEGNECLSPSAHRGLNLDNNHWEADSSSAELSNETLSPTATLIGVWWDILEQKIQVSHSQIPYLPKQWWNICALFILNLYYCVAVYKAKTQWYPL